MFRPSHESLLLQNAEINRLDLPRIQDDDELEVLKVSGALLPIRASDTLRFDPRLDPSRRYSRPWTRDFTEDIGQAYFHRFHQQIQVNSAVRTVKVQKKLRRHNRNAAPADGDTASSHLAGVTVDLQRRGMSKEQVRWMEHYLFYMKALGLSISWFPGATRTGATRKTLFPSSVRTLRVPRRKLPSRAAPSKLLILIRYNFISL